MGQTILILGGGTGGVVAANILKKVLPTQHRIALVDRSDQHVFLASLPLVLTGRRRQDQIRRSLHRLEGPNLQFIQAEVEQFNPDEKTIQTDQGLLSYDSLIVALGAEQQGIPGQEQAFNPYKLQEAVQLHKELASFQRGHIVVFISSLPFPGTIAPYEIVLLLDSYFRKRGLRKKIQISFVTPETRLLEFASPRYSERLASIMTKRDIKVVTNREAHSLSPGDSLTHGDGDIPGDLFIGIPHHLAPAPFRDSVVAGPSGWLEVDPTTLATSVPHVYALGDAAGIKSPAGTWIPKVGFFAHYQAEVVARNLALQYAHQEPRFKFVGGAKGASMLTSFNKGCFIALNAYASPPSMTLSSPTRLAHLSKTVFEKYWLHSWF